MKSRIGKLMRSTNRGKIAKKLASKCSKKKLKYDDFVDILSYLNMELVYVNEEFDRISACIELLKAKLKNGGV